MEGSESCSLATHKRKSCRLSVVGCLWSLRAVPWLSFAITDNRQLFKSPLSVELARCALALLRNHRQQTTDNSTSSTDNRQLFSSPPRPTDIKDQGRTR